MKKIFFAVCCASLAGAAFAQTTGTESRNNIRMVSYFPVPHVSYSEVNVKNQLLLGASGKSGGSFTGRFGTSSAVNGGKTSLVLLPKEGPSSSGYNLTANKLVFNVLSTSGNNVMDNMTLTLGTSSSDSVQLEFSGLLTVKSFSGTLEKLNVKETGKVSSLYLFPNNIKGCPAGDNTLCDEANIAKVKDSSGSTCSHAQWATYQMQKAGTENEYVTKTFLECK